METHLTFDNRGKQLGILIKERLTTDQNLQLKVCALRRIFQAIRLQQGACLPPKDLVWLSGPGPVLGSEAV